MRSDSIRATMSILMILTISAMTLLVNSGSSHTYTPDDAGSEPMRIEIPLIFDEPVMVVNDEGFTEITIEGIEQDRRGFALTLPVHTTPLELPVNSEILSIRLDEAISNSLPFNGAIGSNPGPVPGWDTSLFEVIEEDVPVPEDHIRYEIGTGINLDTGKTMMKLSISVHPVTPGDGSLDVLSSATLVVEYRAPQFEPLDSPVEYDLLILCPDQFTDELEEYAIYKNQTGIKTVVVNLTDIREDTTFTVTGADLQEEMKLFIEKARSTWSIDSVMLAGDVNVLPARQIMSLDGYDDGGSTDGRFLPSDLYFADLYEGGTTTFSTWNDYTANSHDLLWGEYNGGNQDGADLYPDVTVGRVPAGDENELDRMLDKARMYELTAKGSEWFMNATLCGTNTFTYSGHGDTSGINEGEYISDLIAAGPLSSFSSTLHYESLGNLSGIKGTVDDGCGFFEMADHGMYDGWGYTTGVAVSSSLAYGLDNGYKLPVVVLDACLTHGFDNENASEPGGQDPVYGYSYYPPGPGYSNRDCLGEYFHKAPNGGGVATFGCTRVGYGGHGSYHDDRYSGYMNFHIHKAYADGYDLTGQMLSKAWEDYITYVGKGGAYNYKTLTEYMLLGDPTITVGGVEGANMTVRSSSEGETILPGETVTVDFNITNSGFLASLIDITADLNGAATSGWTSEVTPSSHLLDPDQMINGSVNVTAPDHSLMGTQITVTITASSKIVTNPETFDIVFTVGRKWGLELENDPGDISTTQGSRIAGHLNVTNIGNGLESVTVDFEYLPEGWELLLGQTTYDIDPYDDERIPFQVDVSSPCLAGSYLITINVSSGIDPAFSTDVLTVIIEAEFDLSLSGSSERPDIVPGTTGQTYIDIGNLGNSDVSVTFGWGTTDLPGWVLQMNRTVIDLPAFASDRVMVTIGVPEGMAPATYRIFINATDGHIIRSLSIIVNVSRIYQYEAICNQTVKTHTASGGTTFEIEIENLGNIYDLYKITMLDIPDDWTFSASPREISVDPGEIKSVYISFSSIHPHMGNYSFLVSVDPQSNALPTTIRLTVVVDPVFEMDVDLIMKDRTSLPGETLYGTLNITSQSNCDDSYWIELVVPYGFTCEGLNSTIAIGQNEIVEETFIIHIPEDGLAGSYDVLISVGSQNSTMNTTLFTSVRIHEVYDLGIISIPELPDELEPGNTYEIVFEMKNNGNTDDNLKLSLNVSDYISRWVRIETRSLSDIDPGAIVNVSVYITVPSWNVTGGDFNLSIEISSLGTELKTDNLTISVMSSDDDAGNGKGINWILLSFVIAAAVTILIIAIVIGVVFIRRRSGDDIEDLGMEWEEDGDFDDDWDDDYDEEDELEWDDE